MVVDSNSRAPAAFFGCQLENPLTDTYLRSAKGIAIVVDGEKFDGTFDSIRPTLERIEEVCDDPPPVIVIVNKSDRLSGKPPTERDLSGVTKLRGVKLKTTNCHTCENCLEAFNELIVDIQVRVRRRVSMVPRSAMHTRRAPVKTHTDGGGGGGVLRVYVCVCAYVVCPLQLKQSGSAEEAPSFTRMNWLKFRPKVNVGTKIMKWKRKAKDRLGAFRKSQSADYG